MGTQVSCKTYLGGHNSMKDLNDECKSNRWNLFCGEKRLANGQCSTSSVQKTVADAHAGQEINGFKQKMLEHDTIFKNQVFELHRLYRTQRDMMEDRKTKEGHRYEDLIEQSSSSCLKVSPPENGHSSHISRYPLVNSVRSMVSCTEIMNSPMNFIKGNDIIFSQFPSHKVCTKAYEGSEARPSKVRRKLIDLQLPNKEWEERLQSNMKISANGDCIREMMTSLQEGCNSDSNTKISNGLADLNEPVEVEEDTESSSIKIFGHYARNGAVKGKDLPAKPDSGFLGLPKEAMQKPGHSRNYSLNNFFNEKNGNGSNWLPFSYETEHAGANINLVSRSGQRDKPSLHSTQSQVSRQDCDHGIHFDNGCQETPGKEKVAWGLEGFHRREDYANHSCREPTTDSQLCSREPTTDSQLCNSYMFLGSADVAPTRPQIMSPRGNPTDSLSPKLTSFYSQHSSRGKNKTFQASAHNNDMLDEKWYVNNRSHSNPGRARDPPSCNDSPVFGFDHLTSRSSRTDNIASSGLVNYRKENLHMASSRIDTKPLKDLNLNETFPGDAMSEEASHQDLGILDEKSIREDHNSSLHWLQTKPAFKTNEATNSNKNVFCINSSPARASQSSLFGITEIGKDVKGMFKATYSTNHEIWPKQERYETQCVKKIFGVPNSEKLSASENEASPLASSTPEIENIKEEKKIFLIDINVACDDSIVEFGDETDVGVIIEDKLYRSFSVRSLIDLNSCVTEDEDLPIPSGASSMAPVKFVADFDLEEPAVPEEEDNLSDKEKEQSIYPQLQNRESEQLDDGVLMSAAKAIVDILSCQDETQEKSILLLPDAAELESLLWFADVASIADKLKKISGKACSSLDEIDDFEAMTLLLPDTTEEDYMPKPFIPEILVEEAGGNARPPRPRRGQARRGRQRRDFQRDILPGLTTLSKHEMTEDLQTFAGLMRATGHSWNSGSVKKNGGTRGRKRKVLVSQDPAPIEGCTQQMTTVETILEDKRSLTGWGKTTRRPRRQRCPASNAPAVALT